jgi:hypothetical protein
MGRDPNQDAGGNCPVMAELMSWMHGNVERDMLWIVQMSYIL